MSNPSITISTQLGKSLTSVLYLGRLFCLMPLKWQKSEYNYIVKKSTTYVTYSLIVIIFIVSASIYGLSQAYQIDIVYSIRLGSTAAKYVNYADVMIVLGTGFIGVVITSVKINKVVDCLYHLNQFDIHIPEKSPKLGKFQFVTIVTMLYAVSLLLFDMTIWVNMGSKKISPYLLCLYFFPYYLSYLFTVVIELLYWHLSNSVKIRMEILNVKLRQILENRTQESDKKIISVVTNNDVNIMKQKKSNVQNAIKAYIHLTVATDYVNHSYGFIILIVIVGCFIHLLTTPYTLRAITSNTNEHHIFIVSQLIWMIGHIFRLLLIVEPCHGCAFMVKQTSLTICKLIMAVNLDDEIKQSLHMLLLCLSQNKLKFTAYGLTRIDRKLLTAIAGAVTTYLVILFQFN